ncbi:MAG: glutathione S-transferase family protein [Sphingomonadales bacterium]|nr:glutathione S-transferase family protein [Sphingomonadales bacterium]PIX64600.1 MAG: glutathione S-transferase family protein [Sphingomonadales bacterium CG_4_10_14_3_um_filter_58_15]NCO48368.1 glutathione S-transferase family protein [Sphingomonadales bacterium]NCO99148.1 glutathione S-transferase family protein [Sphingomonadales bacterium]NCP26918.1 glutathione S-transferase family protein [Sphingomonadales bacterium]
MSMTLYHGQPNGPSLTVLAALFEKGVDADLQFLDLAAGERHALPVAGQTEVAMSIEGEGPVLLVDGEAMADSVFVGCYLDDIGSGPSLRPADPYKRWQVMMWCRQIIERLAPAAGYLGIHEASAPDISDDRLPRIQSEDLRARWADWRDGKFEDEKLEDSRVKVTQAVEKCEAQLNGHDWLFGDFSLADLETYAWLAGMVTVVPSAFVAAPRTMDWLARTKARPSVKRALAQASQDSPEASWAPGPEINRWG